MTQIVTKDGTLASTSKENVKNNGEVFTPSHIVNNMMDLIPLEFTSDPSAIMIEPTCGNGNFLVAMYRTKRLVGLSIKETLNTIIGMELNKDTLVMAHMRLYELVVNDMLTLGIKPNSNKWLEMAIKCVMIVRNNVFHVNDSLIVMSDYAKGKGKLANKKFVFSDPTGNNEVLTKKQQTTLETQVQKAFHAHNNKRNTLTLNPFFEVSK